MNQRENLTVFPATPPPADKLTLIDGGREEQMRKGSCLKLKACTNSQGRVDGPDDDRKSRTLGLEVI